VHFLGRLCCIDLVKYSPIGSAKRETAYKETLNELSERFVSKIANSHRKKKSKRGHGFLHFMGRGLATRGLMSMMRLVVDCFCTRALMAMTPGRVTGAIMAMVSVSSCCSFKDGKTLLAKPK
jgi:hypothetical protein